MSHSGSGSSLRSRTARQQQPSHRNVELPVNFEGSRNVISGRPLHFPEPYQTMMLNQLQSMGWDRYPETIGLHYHGAFVNEFYRHAQFYYEDPEQQYPAIRSSVNVIQLIIELSAPSNLVNDYHLMACITNVVANEELIPIDVDDATDEIENRTTPLQFPNLSPFDPVERVRKGFAHFKIHKFNKFPEYFRQLAEKQSPKFLVFSCPDSRVCPTNILSFQPGEAFMTRNICGIVPSFDKLRYSGVGATIEYAIEELGVTTILVIGHSRCGGIDRLVSIPDNGETANDFIDDWVSIALPAKRKVLAEYPNLPFDAQCRKCELETVNLSLMNLLSYPYVRARVEKKELELKGGHYDFVEGDFDLWDSDHYTSSSVEI